MLFEDVFSGGNLLHQLMSFRSNSDQFLWRGHDNSIWLAAPWRIDLKGSRAIGFPHGLQHMTLLASHHANKEHQTICKVARLAL